MSNSEETEETKEEIIPGPMTSVEEMQNAIFNYIMTLTKYYMDVEGLSKEIAANKTADLLERYVDALRG